MHVTTVDEMRSLDQKAITQYGIEDIILMENAGHAVFDAIAREFGVAGRSFVVFCGAGNNGGDGFVVARKIHANGGRVRLILLGNPEGYRGSAKTNYEIVRRLPVELDRLEDPQSLRIPLAHCDVIVDAIFGTGLARDVGGIYADVIEAINASGKPVVSVDIPSGVHGDTGHVMGVAVHAEVTVTFGLPKLGNFLYPGFDLGGTLYVTHISFPPAMYETTVNTSINHPPALPKRRADGHKGSFGQALFVAGAASYFGAPYFSALSFLKAGGGYSRLAAPRSMTPFLANKGSEIVFLPQEETASGSIARANRNVLLECARAMDVVVVGPGLSLDPETKALVGDLVREVDKPLVVDGDGLTAVGDFLNALKRRQAPTVLTPHPGEMSRITGKSVAEIDANKIDVVRDLSTRMRAVTVLKGAHSLIGLPDGRVKINLSGNCGMGTAGSGDVLCGAIAAMAGLGLPVEDAVCKGVFLHGFAGDLAAEDIGPDGMTAHDILEYLPLAVKLDREGIPEPFRAKYLGVIEL